eukprot:294226-Alexandrium_andersonii.AAC.1
MVLKSAHEPLGAQLLHYGPHALFSGGVSVPSAAQGHASHDSHMDIGVQCFGRHGASQLDSP